MFAGGPLSPSRGRTICTICQTKQSIKAYCLLFVYFYTAPNSLGYKTLKFAETACSIYKC